MVFCWVGRLDLANPLDYRDAARAVQITAWLEELDATQLLSGLEIAMALRS